MTAALWCDATDGAGHAFSDHAAIVVTGHDAGTFHFCGPHSLDAFRQAMVITGTERQCHLRFPPIGDIILTCANPATTGPADTPAHEPATES